LTWYDQKDYKDFFGTEVVVSSIGGLSSGTKKTELKAFGGSTARHEII